MCVWLPKCELLNQWGSMDLKGKKKRKKKLNLHSFLILSAGILIRFKIVNSPAALSRQRRFYKRKKKIAIAKRLYVCVCVCASLIQLSDSAIIFDPHLTESEIMVKWK